MHVKQDYGVRLGSGQSMSSLHDHCGPSELLLPDTCQLGKKESCVDDWLDESGVETSDA